MGLLLLPLGEGWDEGSKKYKGPHPKPFPFPKERAKS